MENAVTQGASEHAAVRVPLAETCTAPYLLSILPILIRATLYRYFITTEIGTTYREVVEKCSDARRSEIVRGTDSGNLEKSRGVHASTVRL